MEPLGTLYLTVFGAFWLWQMLPMTLAFALLVAICAASVGLAIMQKALSLAMLASIGGYLAPLLLSTGGGSHVALFSSTFCSSVFSPSASGNTGASLICLACYLPLVSAVFGDSTAIDQSIT